MRKEDAKFRVLQRAIGAAAVAIDEWSMLCCDAATKAIASR
jgi:hypothetical protein